MMTRSGASSVRICSTCSSTISASSSGDRNAARVASPSGGKSEYLIGRKNGLFASVSAGKKNLTFKAAPACCTHKRGAALNKHRVAEFLQVFFNVGDCQFTNPGHHGTPAQRMRAAEFGFDVADQAHKQGHILTASEFHALFTANYESFVAP